jgi:hypothetical protein
MHARVAVAIAVVGLGSAIVSSDEAQARRRYRHIAFASLNYGESAEYSQYASPTESWMRPRAVQHDRYRTRASRSARPAAWCGWWLGQHLGMPDRKLWLSRNWASVGHNAGRPDIGVVVVWRHHVGIITARSGDEWIVKSGNDAGRVRERPRSLKGAIAYRRV